MALRIGEIIIIFALCFLIIGVYVSWAESNITSNNDNVTPVNETLENVSEQPIEEVIEDNPVLDPQEEMEIREGEIREEEALSEDELVQEDEEEVIEEEVIEPEIIDEPQEEIIEPTKSVSEPIEQVEEEEVIQDVVIEPEKAPNEAKETPVSTPKKVSIPGIVNSRGYVWVGQKYSNQEVTVIIED